MRGQVVEMYVARKPEETYFLEHIDSYLNELTGYLSEEIKNGNISLQDIVLPMSLVGWSLEYMYANTFYNADADPSLEITYEIESDVSKLINEKVSKGCRMLQDLYTA